MIMIENFNDIWTLIITVLHFLPIFVLIIVSYYLGKINSTEARLATLGEIHAEKLDEISMLLKAKIKKEREHHGNKIKKEVVLL